VVYANEYLYSEDGRPPWDPDDLDQWTPPYLDAWVASAALGQITSRLRFLPYIYVLPMRHPVHVAKQLATAELFAPGRIILGVGTGWLREEFDLVDVSFDTRGARTDEMLEVIALLLSGRDAEFEGRVFSLPPSRMRPVPTERVSVMIGGDSDIALRRAARHDGWLGIDYELAQLRPLIAKLESYRRDIGRENEPFEIFAVCKDGVTPDNVARLEDLGVTMTQDYAWLFKGEPYSPVGKKKDAMSRFAESFINR
jgi:alkanesulfonate monooxygenase SsuD/methylene tetrahydromethanopterin reductase-like flavin-dependent oxidoreductase (luciferase family)